ncbi:MAG: hypothetical protein COA57_12005 [Flavobacteriales bacterium]|nr:hypothetical protein [Bacteroidales bacterium AH-315-I05]PCJ83111.1 MAG: hypothetical protein COA57_12005 [Flavobacteriales bacterium]
MNSRILQNSENEFSDTGTYIIKQIVTNEFGCLDTAYNEIVIGSDFAIYIPSAFMPNSDGVNDFFFQKKLE